MAVSAEESQNRTATLQLAEELGKTCHESYIRTRQYLQAYHIKPDTLPEGQHPQWNFQHTLNPNCRIIDGLNVKNIVLFYNVICPSCYVNVEDFVVCLGPQPVTLTHCGSLIFSAFVVFFFRYVSYREKTLLKSLAMRTVLC